jgi:glycosyltransferase involved in cell wall biosynthesis
MPHLLYLAIGFPPAAKSCAYRMRTTANIFRDLGWEVTVVNLPEQAWEREYGVDRTLLDDVDPGIRHVDLPLCRIDLDPDIRSYSWFRARHPDRWRRWQRRLDAAVFPEVVFGRWRGTIERTALAVHAERPVDLTLVSPAPYTMLPAAVALYSKGVPFAVDYRDAWSLDVIKGEAAFAVNSRAGRWEQRLMRHAAAVWCVNEPIRDFYAQRYPAAADRLRVVRNGFDAGDAVPASNQPATDRAPGSEQPLRFGYLGTVNFPLTQTVALLSGWRAAREVEPVMAGSTFDWRGHIGAASARGSNAHAARIAEYARDGVGYGGPVAKADVGRVYAGWDALLLCLVGGRYVTSGKVYEYMATGLPIVSVHEPEHAASDLLRDYPLHVPCRSLEATDIASAIAQAARLARTLTAERREVARGHAAQYERRAQLEPAVRELAERFGGSAGAAVSADAAVSAGATAEPVAGEVAR